MNPVEKLTSLIDEVEERLAARNSVSNYNNSLRKENVKRTHELYQLLKVEDKHENFETIFSYKAMNLSGIGLKNDDFCEIREGKYVQIISIAYDVNNDGKKIARNLSLGYFGKAEKVSEDLRKNIVEFVLRWRYEKAFRHTEHYQALLSKL